MTPLTLPWPFCASDLLRYMEKVLNLVTLKVEIKHLFTRNRIFYKCACYTQGEHNFKASETEISRNQNSEILLFLDK